MLQIIDEKKVIAAGRAFFNSFKQLNRQERSQLLDFAAFDSVEKTVAFQKCYNQALSIDKQADVAFYAKVTAIFVFSPRSGTFTDTENGQNFGYFLRENGVIPVILAESLFKSSHFDKLVEEVEVLLSRHKPHHQLDFGLLIKDLYLIYRDALF
ncbi:MAG: hypothetical protein BWK79_02990 [Beggiatoa sp. IS2]|nr:MAG: hypothetical protein BWK79_02990 [Beggiatoa sp. IS2]